MYVRTKLRFPHFPKVRIGFHWVKRSGIHSSWLRGEGGQCEHARWQSTGTPLNGAPKEVGRQNIIFWIFLDFPEIFCGCLGQKLVISVYFDWPMHLFVYVQMDPPSPAQSYSTGCSKSKGLWGKLQGQRMPNYLACYQKITARMPHVAWANSLVYRDQKPAAGIWNSTALSGAHCLRVANQHNRNVARQGYSSLQDRSAPTRTWWRHCSQLV